jgi:hypothetical protein
MPRTRPATLIVALALLFVAGCSTVVTGQASPVVDAAPEARSAPEGAAPDAAAGPPSAEGVAWADQVCGAFLEANTVLTDQPRPDPTNATGTISSYSQYFGRTVPALDSSIGRLQGIGAGPLPGGDTVINSMTTIVTLTRDGHRAAKAAVDAIDPASPTALTLDMQAALELTNVADQAPEIDVGATPELNAAAEAAPNCQAYGAGS